MSGPAKKRATYADLCAVPERYVAEIIGGELRALPRPAPRHARAASKLGERLGGAFDSGRSGPGGWWIFDEPELHLPSGDVLVPDVAGWRVERMAELPDAAYFELPPDWVCEILSPSTAAEDRADKMPRYAGVGVAHAWLVDPLVRTLEVFRLERGRWTLLATHKGDAIVRAEPFDAVELELGALWGPPARPAPSRD
jgi:Uma2 family endonuclease